MTMIVRGVFHGPTSFDQACDLLRQYRPLFAREPIEFISSRMPAGLESLPKSLAPIGRDLCVRWFGGC